MDVLSIHGHTDGSGISILGLSIEIFHLGDQAPVDRRAPGNFA